MTQEELKGHLDAVDAQTDDAFATLTQMAKHTVNTKARLAAGLQAVLDILNSAAPDPAVTLELVPGTPREQPTP